MAVPATLQEWRNYVARNPRRPEQLNARQLAALTPSGLEAYNGLRFAWLGADTVLGTPDVRNVRRLWATLRAETLFSSSISAKSLSISGAPTYGKTTTAMWIAREHERKERARHPSLEQDDIQPSLYVVTPPATTPKMLMTTFCNVLGLPHTRSSTAQDLTERIHCVLGQLGTSLIVVDEVHNVQSNRQVGAEAASTLKLFAERLDCAFLLTGIDLDRSPVFAGPVGEQLASRSIRYDMAGYRFTSKRSRAEWTLLVDTCQELLPLARKSEQAFTDSAAWLFDVTGGSIGRLRSLLRRAAIDAIISGREQITKPDMEAFAKVGGFHPIRTASAPAPKTSAAASA